MFSSNCLSSSSVGETRERANDFFFLFGFRYALSELEFVIRGDERVGERERDGARMGREGRVGRAAASGAKGLEWGIEEEVYFRVASRDRGPEYGLRLQGTKWGPGRGGRAVGSEEWRKFCPTQTRQCPAQTPHVSAPTETTHTEPDNSHPPSPILPNHRYSCVVVVTLLTYGTAKSCARIIELTLPAPGLLPRRPNSTSWCRSEYLRRGLPCASRNVWPDFSISVHWGIILKTPGKERRTKRKEGRQQMLRNQ